MEQHTDNLSQQAVDLILGKEKPKKQKVKKPNGSSNVEPGFPRVHSGPNNRGETVHITGKVKPAPIAE